MLVCYLCLVCKVCLVCSIRYVCVLYDLGIAKKLGKVCLEAIQCIAKFSSRLK